MNTLRTIGLLAVSVIAALAMWLLFINGEDEIQQTEPPGRTGRPERGQAELIGASPPRDVADATSGVEEAPATERNHHDETPEEEESTAGEHWQLAVRRGIQHWREGDQDAAIAALTRAASGAGSGPYFTRAKFTLFAMLLEAGHPTAAEALSKMLAEVAKSSGFYGDPKEWRGLNHRSLFSLQTHKHNEIATANQRWSIIEMYRLALIELDGEVYPQSKVLTRLLEGARSALSSSSESLAEPDEPDEHDEHDATRRFLDINEHFIRLPRDPNSSHVLETQELIQQYEDDYGAREDANTRAYVDFLRRALLHLD